MKIRYLLLGLMMCVAGAGTIDSSGGSFGGQNATPFLIFGHVCCEDGFSCNNPIVNITNACTGVAWCADTISGSDYYQTLLCGANVSLGDLLEFDVTDGAGYNTTTHAVTRDEIDNGGIFGFNLTLLSTIPRIVGFAPPSPVHGTENATRTFGITVDQVVDVTWLINGTEVFDEADVNESYYTNTSAAIGVWNVTAVASNQNGTDAQEWVWHVNPPSPPPPSPMFVIYGEVFYENNMPVYAPCVVVTDLNTSRKFVADNRTGSNFYQIITGASEMRTGDLLRIDASKDGALAGRVNHIVTSNESRSGAIRVDINRGRADLRVVGISTPPYIFDNVTSTINATIANNGTADSNGFNVSLAVDGSAIGSAHIRSLGVGCAADVTFNWTPLLTGDHRLTVTADSDGKIDESDEGNNGTSMDVFVGVPDFTITDLTFDTPVDLYNDVIINATVANYGIKNDTVEICFYVDGTPFDTSEVFVPAGGTSSVTTIWNATLAAHHNITAVADPKNSTPEINESNNNLIRQIFVDASDLTVTDISIAGYVFDPEYPDETDPTFERPNNVTAAIANIGNLSACAAVEFHSGLDISSEPIHRYIEGWHHTSNDTITQPNASKMRVHFGFIIAGRNSDVTIYDKNNNTVGTIHGGSSRWSNWVDGDVIRMHAYIGGTNESIWFVVDKYEYIFAEAAVSLDAHNSTNISRIWHADPAIIANETQSRYMMLPCYNISVIADPNDAVTELNESNNVSGTPAELWYPYDFAVTNITFSPERPREGEPVTIDASVGNIGFRGIDTDVAFYVDGNLIGTADVYAEANKTEHVSAIWDALPDINHLTEEHNITVMVDPKNGIEEQDELNNNKTRSINVPLANLTITDISTDPAGMIIGDTVDVIATIRNNEDAVVNSTVWFCEENSSLNIHDYKDKPKSPIIHYITHQGALMMRAYYRATVNVDRTGGTVEVYINDRRVLTCTSGNYPLAGWTGWTSGSTEIVNITLVEEGVPYDDFGIDYNIDRYQTVFGNTSLTMSTSESANLSMNWSVIQKNPRLIVTTSNATNSTDVSVSGTDLAVTDVSVSDNIVRDGDLVNINATITNFGGMNASNFTVEFYDVTQIIDRERFITTERVSSLAAGDSVNITVPWIASLKVGEDISCYHRIKAEVIPQDSYIEDNSTNNTRYSDTVTVKRSRDFSVTNIEFFRGDGANETLDPMDLRMGELATINATVNVTNLASCGGSVDVACYLDNTTSIGSRTVSFSAGNGTVHTEFEWDVDVHGNHTITVIADQENETSEFDESNNASSQSIYIRAPDLVVTNLTFDPESPEEGGVVNITADVANLGNMDAGDVNLTIYDCTDAMYDDSSYRLTPGQTITRDDATAMRLYTWLYIQDGSIHLYDCQNQLIVSYNASSSKQVVWTPWAFGGCITMEYEGSALGWGEMQVHEIEYTTARDTINTTNPALMAGGDKHITVKWNTSLPGEYQIFAILDPEKRILESDESNNNFARTLIVRGADLTVSDMRVTANGTEINGTETVIAAGDIVNISATVTNIGIRPASNFSVSFCADCTEIANTTNLSLNMGESVNVSAEWNAVIGNYTIAVAADSEKQIHETNESNNTAAMDVSVQGADLLITDITYTVIPPENATANDSCSRVYDADTIMVNATITDQGILPADNFSTYIFYEEKGLGGFNKVKDTCGYSCWRWINRTLEDASCMYVRIQDAVNIKGNLKIYDRNGSLTASPEGDGWFFVDGGEANVYFHDVHGVGVSMSFYAGEYQRYGYLSIGTGKSMNLTMPQHVFTGDHPIRVFVDPENNICENRYENNYADMALTVHPSRDFTVNNMQLFRNGSQISVNDTIMDGDTVLVNAAIGMGINKSDPYHEYRKGDADAAIIDEHEWVNVSPRFKLTPYGYAQVITHPGADAIKVHFEEMSLAPYAGYVEIRDGNGTVQWSRGYYDGATDQSSWVDGDTIYVYMVEKMTSYNYVWGRTTFSIDKYRYRRSNHTAVPLVADETRSITTGWDVSAGNHTMQATIDMKDAVGEINESNNDICRTLHVEACKDPAILNLTFDPEKPAVGSDVVINASIMNKGHRTVSFTVDLWAEKTECHPFESPHDEDLPYWDYGWEVPSTYPDADWMGIHFTRINMWREMEGTLLKRNLYVRDENDTMVDNFCGLDEKDVWTWVRGDATKLSTTGCAMFPDYPVPVWGFEITDHRYKIVLNRTTVTLAPNETANVTGILRNVRAGNHSMNYTIHANLDMDNIVHEVNESNNEMVRVLNLAVPDFTVKIQHKQDGNIRAVFKNTGFGSTDARIFFSRDIHVDDSVSGSYYCYTPNKTIRKSIDWADDIDWTRIHFEEMKVRAGGYVEVGNKRYKESKSDFWLPWIKGDRIKMKYHRASFKIDRYDFAVEDFINGFGGGDSESLDIPWERYTEPYNLTVWIDPLDEVLEGDENDNNDTAIVYADLVADRIEFISPEVDKLSLDAEKFILDGHIENGGGDRDDIVAPVSDFNVTLDVRRRYQNGTVSDVFNMTKHIEEPFSGQNMIRFEFDPKEKFEVGGNYTVSLIADSTGDVCESNNLYPEGEDNNATSVDVHVYNSSGYTGGGELVNVAQGEVNGRVVYTVGDEPSCQYSGMTPSGGEKTVTYTGVVPKGSGNIEFARLFVYWFTWDPGNPVLAGMNAAFNGHSLTMAGNYSDHPGATMFDTGYGLYSYDVTDYVTKGENKATVRITSEWSVGIDAIGLLVVYEDEDEPFTKYWVNEGADIMMAGNGAFPTGLLDGDCITTATFDDVEREDTENVNASLLTVLGFYMAYGEPSDDALEFNGKSVGSRIHSDGMSGYWEPHYRDTGIALTNDRWEDVTDDLERGDNLAKIWSKGNFMMPNNAFLRLIFPPDLNIINLTAPASTVVGAHHSINVTIRNDGRSDAHDFNATLEIDGRQMVRIPNLDLAAGENMTIHLYNWTPMLLGHVYNLTAAADVLSGEDWTEIETDNNALTKYVSIEEGGFGNQTGPRGTGGGSKPTGGEFTKKITGRIMQGTKEFLSGGGGGGAGMFSALEWLMKGAVWLVLVLFVGLGYRMEKRSYGRVSGGYAGGL